MLVARSYCTLSCVSTLQHVIAAYTRGDRLPDDQSRGIVAAIVAATIAPCIHHVNVIEQPTGDRRRVDTVCCDTAANHRNPNALKC